MITYARPLFKIFIASLVVCLLDSSLLYPGGFDRELGFAYPLITQHYKPKPFKPNQYVIYRTIGPIAVDGSMDESSWMKAEWTNRFGHIFMEGYKKPFLATRVKMLWDDENLYAAAELEEPNLLGHMIDNDQEMYLDNDIELFIDVDNDSQDYIELEFNCLGTIWDMLLPKEYNRGGIPFSHPKIEGSPPWDLDGMLAAVRVDGSLNYPYDTDKNWVIELSIPWDSLEKTNGTGETLNRNGSVFRLNFSRVQHPWPPNVWPIVDWEARGGSPWDWTWSSNLVYNMHVCETWGRVIISDKTVLEPTDYNLENAFAFIEPPSPRKKPKVGSMARIKGGTFIIGPDDTDSEASPQGEVTVDDFFIDKYEVTIGEFTQFLNKTGEHGYYQTDMANPDFCGIVKNGNGSYSVVPGKDLYPVVLLDLAAAKAYAEWCGKRLPTEFEWEIAACGKEGRTYPWGNEPLDSKRANYHFMVGYPAPVGSYEGGKTPEGVYDLAGNVWEMVDGNWAEYSWDKKAEKPRTSGPLMRGGSWVTSPANMKAAYRDAMKGGTAAMYGFRCARDGDASGKNK